MFTLNVPPDLEHVYEPLPCVFLVVYLDVFHEPCEVISQHLFGEHVRRAYKFDSGLVALRAPVLHLPVEFGSIRRVAETVHSADYTDPEVGLAR